MPFVLLSFLLLVLFLPFYYVIFTLLLYHLFIWILPFRFFLFLLMRALTYLLGFLFPFSFLIQSLS
ncbi:TPA: hypothetical protein DCZ16_01925 [Candidatus Peregrinibacteria bacterium]|nr:hypothetical protein [Candidatus Peregrinibacteria bacterium]